LAVDGRHLGLVALALGVGATALLLYRDHLTMDPWYLLLLVVGVTGISFAVGWVLGYLTESGIAPGPGDRE
jgi:hypothetical protein